MGKKARKRKQGSRSGRSTAEASPARRIRAGTLVLAAVVSAWAMALYVGSLDHPFVYDDLRTITGNPSIHPPFDLERILIYERFRPLVNLSYAADVAFQGEEPAAFHRTNLVLHGLAAFLLFFLVRAAVRDVEDRAPGLAPPGGPDRLAAAATLLWGVHPLQTETVAYASARSEVLCSVFLFASLLALRRWMHDRRPVVLGLGIVFFLLAAGSRELGAMVPFVALAWDRLLGPADGARERLVRVHLPWSALVGLAGLWRVWQYVVVEAANLPRPAPIHFMTELTVIWRYARMTVWPTGQSLIHPAQSVRSVLDPTAVVAGLALLGVVAACWRFRRRAPLEVLGVAWWLLLLAPSSSVVPLNELIAEHRVYAASAGLVLALLGLAGRAAARWLPARVPRAVVVVVLAGALSVATVRRLEVWASPLALWEDAARKAPLTWRAVFGHGDALRVAGDCPGAIEVLERARQLSPEHRGTRINIGICHAQLGHYEEARRSFEELVAEDPTYVQGFNNLGRLATIRKDYDAALAYFARSLVLEPDNVMARLNLIHIHEEILPDPARALRLCRELRRIAPQVDGMEACIERNERRLRELGIGA